MLSAWLGCESERPTVHFGNLLRLQIARLSQGLGEGLSLFVADILAEDSRQAPSRWV